MWRVIKIRKWMASAEGIKGAKMPTLGLSESRSRNEVIGADGDLLVTV